MLRLTTCVDVASEALLHHRYGNTASRNTTLRQASTASADVVRLQREQGRVER